MSASLLSRNWYRVSGLRPRLRGHVRIHRHAYRGQVWHVVEDRVGGKHHRFNAMAYRVLSLMDGQRTMQDVWALIEAETREGDGTGDIPTQEELIQLLGQLHAVDLILCDVTPDVAELFERRGQQVRRKWMGRVGNPMSLKLPLFDPDRHVARLARVLAPLNGRGGVLLWLALVLPALILSFSHGRELAGNFAERMLATENLVLVAILFPLIKAVHELGHALACRLQGGEVHETGLMLLVLYPVPYVDVSHSSAFVSKWHRALVGAAGMLAELMVAAMAFYLWLLLEPGLARSIAYNVAVLASVTTLFFNANPLLRYDGYYILADLIEIPNLGNRANQYWLHLIERHIFGVHGTQPPQATPGERRWFLLYAPLAMVYRLSVSLGIALLLAQQFFVVGVLLAAWTIATGMLWPVAKGLKAVFTQQRFAARAQRVRAVLAGTLATFALLLFALPLPYHTVTEGVLWLPDKAVLRAETGGFVRAVLARPGQRMAPGQPVIESVDPGLQARLEAQQARIEEIQAKYDAAWSVAQSQAEQLDQELQREQGVLDSLQDEARRLTLRSQLDGTLLLDNPSDLPGRYLKKGDVVGYVRTAEPPVVRGVVAQADIDAVRLDTRSVEVRLAQRSQQTWQAHLSRAIPAAGHQLPSAVLGHKGGGPALSDPRDEQGLTTLESVFEFELAMPRDVPSQLLGGRVTLRFEHSPEPIGWRWLRAVRRAFLSQLQV
ncbi:MAG: hypothetical protein QM742_03845 [Aquabacterium sp.]